MLLAANIAVEQEVIVTAIKIALFNYIYALLTYNNTCSVEAEQKVCSETPTPEVGLQNLLAKKCRS